MPSRLLGVLVAGSCGASACFTDTHPAITAADAETGTSSPDPGTTAPADTSSGSEDSGSGESGSPTTADPVAALCEKLGGLTGVHALAGDFTRRLLVDDRINAYFLTTKVDTTHLTACLMGQLGELTGCDVEYDCKGMKNVHAGLGVSDSDFVDLVANFGAAFDAHRQDHPGLTEQDKTDLLEALGGMAEDIVEDEDNDDTLYQELGRRPALAAIVGGPDTPGTLLALVAGDVTIDGFFASTDFARLQTCLTRQLVTLTGGPNIYGKEVDAPPPADPGVGSKSPCLDMKLAHVDLFDANDQMGVAKMDFDALVGHLVTAMDGAGLPVTDQNDILEQLGPLCTSIVTVDPEAC